MGSYWGDSIFWILGGLGYHECLAAGGLGLLEQRARTSVLDPALCGDKIDVAVLAPSHLETSAASRIFGLSDMSLCKPRHQTFADATRRAPVSQPDVDTLPCSTLTCVQHTLSCHSPLYANLCRLQEGNLDNLLTNSYRAALTILNRTTRLASSAA